MHRESGAHVLQAGEAGAKRKRKEVILIIKRKLVGDLFGSGFRASERYESDRDSCEQNLSIKGIVEA